MRYKKFLKFKNMKFFVILALISYLLLCLLRVNSVRVNDSNKLELSLVVIHLDLKGAPPKLSYLMDQFPVWKHLGVNGLLIEYEDMFPYETLPVVCANNSYNRHILTNFLLEAINYGFEIIPLIQTFGHMEFLLKLEQFQHLREDPAYNDVICPSQDEAFMLIKKMLTEVMLFHRMIQPLKHIHIGCDEVYHLKKCPLCISKKITRNQLFQQTVNKIQKYIKWILPDTKVLIWDDMLRKRAKALNKLEVEPVVWHYEHNPQFSHVDLYRYYKKFKDIWIATAFKGADGDSSLVPDLNMRYSNHYNMIKFIKGYRFGGLHRTYNFKGLVLTGWSRYSHMDPIVDLLPAAYPSLILNLLLINKFLNDVKYDMATGNSEDFFIKHLATDVSEYLKCKVLKKISDINSINCRFKGVSIYGNLTELSTIRTEVFRSEVFSKFSEIDYYNKSGYMNSNWIDKVYGHQYRLLQSVRTIERNLRENMKDYYDGNVIEEFVNYATFSVKNVLIKNINIMTSYKKVKTWKQRRKVKLKYPATHNITLNKDVQERPKNFFVYYFI